MKFHEVWIEVAQLPAEHQARCAQALANYLYHHSRERGFLDEIAGSDWLEDMLEDPALAKDTVEIPIPVSELSKDEFEIVWVLFDLSVSIAERKMRNFNSAAFRNVFYRLEPRGTEHLVACLCGVEDE